MPKDPHFCFQIKSLKMKKSIFWLLSLMLLCSSPVFGQATRMRLGFVDGHVNTSGTKGFSTTEKNTWVSGAIRLDKSKLALYAGNHIDSINAGLASRLNVDSLRVWIRTSLDGQDIASGAISGKSGSNPRAQKGWNALKLDKSVQIDASQDLYVGYSFLQKGNCVALSVVDKPNDGALYCKLGTNAEWTDRGSEGSLAIEAFVYGDNLPQHNLKISSLTTQKVFVVDKGILSVTAKVKNVGAATTKGFDVKCQIDGIDKPYTVHLAKTLEYEESDTVNFNLRPAFTAEMSGNRTMTMTIVKLDEGDDIDPSDNSATATFEVVEHDFTRNVLIEEFTTEECVNCPRLAGYLHQALDDPKISGRAVAVCHHSGYKTDWLTIPADREWLWFFNGNGPYAPAMMFNRTKSFDDNVVFDPASKDVITAVVTSLMNQPAFVSLDIKAKVDENNANLLHVTVDGERTKEDFTTHPARINVMITEDNIKAKNQQGADDTYIQQHVGRVTDTTWGTEIEWNGNDYTYSCDLPLLDTYNRDNLNIVAWIWDYDPEDATNCNVANVVQIPFNNVTNGIKTGTANDNGKTEYYTLDGCRIDKNMMHNGVYIVRKAGVAKKIIVQ